MPWSGAGSLHELRHRDTYRAVNEKQRRGIPGTEAHECHTPRQKLRLEGDV